jgi:merlin protein
MPLFNIKSNENSSLVINVKTYDEELELPIEYTSKGNRLFESICASLGLRETWYFGLTYESKKYDGILKWLKMDSKLSDLKLIKYSDNTIKMLLLIKFYPEDVTSELIQEYTQHLFYLQARQQIINEVIYCPAELCILLASYAAQAKVFSS